MREYSNNFASPSRTPAHLRSVVWLSMAGLISAACLTVGFVEAAGWVMVFANLLVVLREIFR